MKNAFETSDELAIMEVQRLPFPWEEDIVHINHNKK